MPENKNALAELAVQLEVVHEICVRGCASETAVGNVVRTAQRIVAELAKIEYSACGSPENPLFAMKRLDNCRAIAEEGAGDGK